MDIWGVCGNRVVPGPLSGELARVVESQEAIATNRLVDNFEEQALLEQLIEASKPSAAAGTRELHDLLATPFRYPPLRHGSRFGARHEPNLFYGAADTDTALAETAYYRLVFWTGMQDPPPSGKLTTEHTAFGVRYDTAAGLQLHNPAFAACQDALADPAHYATTQRFGRVLRKIGIEAFEYQSARVTGPGINVALFSPGAIAVPKPLWQAQWLCETRGNRVAFYNPVSGARWFERDQFEVDGVLPTPAV